MFHEENFDSPRQVIGFEDDMLVSRLKAELILDLECARRIVVERREFTKDHRHSCMMVINDDYLLFENEAFDHFASPESLTGCTAFAVVIKSPLRKILTNFNLLFHRQSTPFRVFTSEHKARVWLFGYMKEELLDFD